MLLAHALRYRRLKMTSLGLMTSVSIIIQQIERTVDGVYGDWTIGATDDPQQRKAQSGNPLNWLHWQTLSDKDAEKVVTHFAERGMFRSLQSQKGTFVYIF